MDKAIGESLSGHQYKYEYVMDIHTYSVSAECKLTSFCRSLLMESSYTSKSY